VDERAGQFAEARQQVLEFGELIAPGEVAEQEEVRRLLEAVLAA